MMQLGTRIATLVSLALMVVALAGIGARRLYRICHAFPVYLAAVFSAELLILIWPARFYVWSFWVAKETTFAVVKLAIAAEIAVLAYAAFPGAQAALRRLTLLVLAGVLLLLTVRVPYGAEFPALVLELQARLAQGTALVFCVTWGLVHWYHLPLHRFHRAILRGFVAYLVVFTTCAAALSLGWEARDLVKTADGAAYALLLAYWSWEAWRAPEAEDPFLQQLQPWRA